MKRILFFQSSQITILMENGFTLVELLVTLAIISIITPVIYISFFNHNKIYNTEIKKYEKKNDSRVIIMELEDSIKNSGFSSCSINDTPGKDLCLGSNIVKRLVYVEPIKKSLKPYLIVIKINSNGVKELGRVTVSPDTCSAYKTITDSWQIESMKEIIPSAFVSESINIDDLTNINSSINTLVLQKEFEGLSVLPASDPEILTINPPIEGVKSYYKDPSGRIYADIEIGGKKYKALLKHIKYEKVPYMADSYNIILDGINDIRINKADDFTYSIEIDTIYNNKTITYSTSINTKNAGRRSIYE